MDRTAVVQRAPIGTTVTVIADGTFLTDVLARLAEVSAKYAGDLAAYPEDGDTDG